MRRTKDSIVGNLEAAIPPIFDKTAQPSIKIRVRTIALSPTLSSASPPGHTGFNENDRGVHVY